MERSFWLYFLEKGQSINRTIGEWMSWGTGILVVLVCIDVLVRYIFKHSSAFFAELEWHIFSLIFLLGAGYTLQTDKHVRVDLFYAKYSPKKKAVVNLLGCILFIFPFSIVVIESCLPFIKVAYVLGEGSPDPGGLGMRFLIKSTIVLSFILLCLQALLLCIQSLLELIESE